tara:strand:+ start:119 stop:430 length:312 start_codon:yes stop_codon:yes gene_type:complete
LTQKRAELLERIKVCEAQIAHSKHDLAHVNATIALFSAPERQRARYMVSHGFIGGNGLHQRVISEVLRLLLHIPGLCQSLQGPQASPSPHKTLHAQLERRPIL